MDSALKPALRDTEDKATFNRLYPVPFTVQITDDKIDPRLGEQLEAELEGIFALAVKGAEVYCKRGLGKPVEVKEVAAEWRQENDVVARWLESCCERGQFFTASG
jgi:putative DNA primase/helicase